MQREMHVTNCKARARLGPSAEEDDNSSISPLELPAVLIQAHTGCGSDLGSFLCKATARLPSGWQATAPQSITSCSLEPPEKIPRSSSQPGFAPARSLALGGDSPSLPLDKEPWSHPAIPLLVQSW